ncbi:MAG: low molecular weight phosphotyrosine protein phosphatase [Clostridia bacterium]|nr:low molecular weight phosphotyrosine protein phosphatase [Clostridia bacterium]
MIKILFVCHGNICRSPMAEFIFKDMVKKAGKEEEFLIASAATSSEEIYMGKGNPVYPPAREQLLLHGIDPKGKTAVRLTKEDYKKYDLLIGMDSMNIRNMKLVLGSDPENKIKKLLDFCGGGDVSDPWYTDRFKEAYESIYKGCEALFNALN